MAKYLNDHSTVESLSEKLRLVCPTIFSADDAIYAKVCYSVYYVDSSRFYANIMVF